jgi:translocation and assembly module TamA
MWIIGTGSCRDSEALPRLSEDNHDLRPLSFFLLLFLALCLPLVSASEPVTVVIDGAEGAALDNLKATLRLPPGLVAPDGAIDEGLFEQFLKRIPADGQEALEPFGYYSSRVAVVSRKRASDRLVHVRVDLGDLTRVGSMVVRVEGPGATERELQELANAFPLKEGDVLLSDTYETAKAALQTKGRNLGYLDAEFPTHDVRVYRLTGIAEIELTLATGERYYFGETSFSGAPNYPDTFLRRYVNYRKGEPFSYLKLGQMQTSLNNADRFRQIAIQASAADAKGQEVPVAVTLEPRPEKQIKTGVGYGTDTGARFLTRYQDVNVFNGGHEFRSELNISERLLGITGAYIVPTGDTLRSLTALRLSLVKENTVSYDSDLLALELDRERGFGENIRGVGFVRLLKERFTISNETSTSFMILPGIRLIAQKVDSLVRPRMAYKYGLELRGTDTFLGSSAGLLQVLPTADLLVPLPARLTLLLRSQAGITFQRSAFDEVPVSLRFFAGGDRSVRGYAYQSLGPRNREGNVTGGKHLLFGSAELERAIRQDWGVAVFYDTGNAFDSFTEVTLAQSAGLGLRYYSKIGPFRLDIARQLNVASPAIRVHFVVGIFL